VENDLTVDETSIRQWADRHECRRSIPILVRRLIRETTPSLSSLRFPGNEAVDLPGLDGEAQNGNATIWVPEGRSVWEIGCNAEPRAKAQEDYLKRTDEVPEEVRGLSSFVFVTPRRWNRKTEWLVERRREGAWASVHAYDATDLEAWLEEAPATTRWIGEMLGIACPGLMTPHEWWNRWATACAPPISKGLVSNRRYNEHVILLSKLRDGDGVISIQADDRKEAVAFVVASLIEADALDLLDRTLLATSGGVRIPAIRNKLIVIADIDEGEEPDFGDRRGLTIVRPYPKGRLDVQDAILLSHVPSDIFRGELEAMGLSREEAESRSLQTGHSVAVLRRQLSSDPEVKRPPWARDRTSSKLLLPFALAGAWIEHRNTDDEAVLQLLGELGDGEVESIRDQLLALDDAPIARYGNVNVIVSQLDALFAVGPYIERDDLERFFQLVPELFGDRDPALDLPRDQWWMANVLGKARNYSAAMLAGLGDALCILSIHGAQICGDRLNTDLGNRAGRVVRSLLAEADDDRWLTIRGHLRILAEASPTSFLDCMENELRKADPPIKAIMGTTGGASGGECLRTNLLWALEQLAWHPAYFPRVAEIVFRLRRIEVEDNWSNSPKSTARSLFLAWLPSTCLGVADRMRVLSRLSEHFRDQAIDVCVALLPGGGPAWASRTVRPQWRQLGAEVPEPTNIDVRDAAIEASRILLELAPFTKSELRQTIEVATRLHPDDLKRLVLEVERWAGDAEDIDCAELRHVLRHRDVLRAYQETADEGDLAAALHRMGDALEPADPRARHRWLFENSHVEWRALVEGEMHGRMSWQDRQALVQDKRREAVADIQNECGEDAIFPFALSVAQPELVAEILAPPDAAVEDVVGWVQSALEAIPSLASDAFLRQILWSAGRNNSLCALTEDLLGNGFLEFAEQRRRFAEHLPGLPAGWRVAEALGDDIESTYWNTVHIRIFNDSDAESIEHAPLKLLEANRPRAAFLALEAVRQRLSAGTWVRILQAIARGAEPEGPFPSAYSLDEVFEYLDAAYEVSNQQIANLELPFVPILCQYGHRNHERKLAIHLELARDPALFVQLLTWQYRRRDGAIEGEQQELSAEHQEQLAQIAYHALAGWKEVPGLGENGEIDAEEFTRWALNAFQISTEMDRREVAEAHFAALLARLARRRGWDAWLPECVLDLLDRPEHSSLRERFDLGVRNARGVTSRGPYDGGEQERKLAGRYRDLAVRYENSHPRVSAMLISIAEGYEWDGRREDDQAAVNERWHP